MRGSSSPLFAATSPPFLPFPTWRELAFYCFLPLLGGFPLLFSPTHGTPPVGSAAVLSDRPRERLWRIVSGFFFLAGKGRGRRRS